MSDVERLRTVDQLIQTGRDLEAARQGALGSHVRSTTGLPAKEGGIMDPLTQLSQLGPVLGGVVADITPDQLDLPTPCTEFTVRGVLEHLIGGATTFTAAFRGQPPAEPDLSYPLNRFAPVLDDLAAAIAAPGALDRTVAAPFGEVSGEMFARFVVLDGLVHGWDLATSTGQAYEPPAELVAAVNAFAHQTLDALRDGQTFADAVEPAADASPIERLIAFTGRRPLAGATR